MNVKKYAYLVLEIFVVVVVINILLKFAIQNNIPGAQTLNNYWAGTPAA